jgi:hypothetical protein
MPLCDAKSKKAPQADRITAISNGFPGSTTSPMALLAAEIRKWHTEPRASADLN